MSGKDLLLGMNYIDEAFVAEAGSIQPSRKGRVSTLLVLAAVISALAFGAFAVDHRDDAGDWFIAFFTDSKRQEAVEGVTENQNLIMDSGLVELNRSVTDQGYTVTLESGICDGHRMLLKFRIDAPEGTVLEGLRYYMDADIRRVTAEGERDLYGSSFTGISMLEDSDQQDSSVSVLLDFYVTPSKNSGYLLTDGAACSVTLTNFRQTKNAEGEFSDTVLCDGNWAFELVFQDGLLVTEQTQILDSPVRIDCAMMIDNRLIHNRKIPVKTKVISFELRAMTATMIHRRPLIAMFEGVVLDEPIYLVMKDGSRVQAKWRQSNNLWEDRLDESLFIFERPISVEDVDYVLFPGAGAAYIG